MDTNALRVELIEAICRLPGDRLQQAAEVLRPMSRADAGAPSSSPMKPTLAPPPTPLRDWPRAPLHRLSEQGTYMVTTGTYRKAHIFRDPARLDLLETSLLSLASKYDWHLEAWCVFSNHYHFVGHTFSAPSKLREFLSELHANTAREVNRLDEASGRQIWHNFWDK